MLFRSPFWPISYPNLDYELPECSLHLSFRPVEFTQINHDINAVLVRKALRLLSPEPGEFIGDMFCGLGNFTLPIATMAGQVLGVEGSETLVTRARQNLHWNQERGKSTFASTQFIARNLFEMTPQMLVADGTSDKWLVDPPREGAFALVQALAALHKQPELRQGWSPPKRIVYVSCNPATLARDAGILVHVAGYTCSAAGVVNMFPHTAHVESMAVFDLPI